MRPKRIIVGLAALGVLMALAFPVGAGAAAVKWTGGAGDHKWGTKGNWSNTAVPTSSDDVTIDNTSPLGNNPTVDASGADSSCNPCQAKSVSLSGNKQLTIAAATLDVSGGTMSAPAGTNVTVSGGVLKAGTLTVANAAGLTLSGGAIGGTVAASSPTTITNGGTQYTSTAGNFALGTNVTLDQTVDIATTGAVTIDTNSQTYILDGTNLTGGSAAFKVDAFGTLRHQGSTGGTLEPQVLMDFSGGGTIVDASSGGSGLQLKNPNGVTNELAGTLRTTNANATISLTGPNPAPATGNSYALVGTLTTDNTAGGTIQMTGPKVSLGLETQTMVIDGTFLWDATATGANAELIGGSGTFSGPGGGATSTLKINAGGLTGGSFQAGHGVGIAAGTTMDVKNADMSWPDNFELDVSGVLKLEDHSVRDSSTPANTPILGIEPGGDLIHTGTAVSTVEPQVNSRGTIEDDSSAASGQLNLEKSPAPPTITNSLAGTIKTDNANSTVRLGIDTHGVASGGLTTDNTAGGTIEIQGNGTVFDLHNRTVTIKGTLLWDASATGANAEKMMGSGTFTGPGGGATSTLRIKGGGSTLGSLGGTFQAGQTVTIAPGTTMDLFNNDMTWPDTNGMTGSGFHLIDNGTLQLEDTSIGTTWDMDAMPDPANSPVLTIGSTGDLKHTGTATSIVQAKVDSTGVIEDNSSGGVLHLEKAASITNILGGTLRTVGSSSDLQLGTDVHQVDPGGLTMDTTAGGRIETGNNALIKLDDGSTGHTLTLKGSSLDLTSGTLSTNHPATIAGPGTLNLTGGSLALGGPLTVTAPVTQGTATDVGGFGGELDIGGPWTSNADITDTGNQQTLIKVLAAGALQHTGSSPSKVLHPLVIDGLVDDVASGGAPPNWTLDPTNSLMNGGNFVTVDPGGTVQVDANTLRIINLSNYGPTLTNGNYVLTGTLQIQTSGQVSNLNANVTLNGGGMLVNKFNTDALAGLNTIASGGSLTLGNKTQTVSSPLTVDGLLAGTGTVTGGVVNDGTVSPGHSPGTLNIMGGYKQGPSGTLHETINGTGAGQFSVLNVSGNVFLDGKVMLAPSTGYAASATPGDSQAFLTYGGFRNGTFSSTTVNPTLAGGKPYTVTYDDAHNRVLAVVGQAPSAGGGSTTTGATGGAMGGSTGTGPSSTAPGSSSPGGPGSAPTPISNAFTVDVDHHPRRGTATLVVHVPGPGTITISGPGMQMVAQEARAAGDVSLPLKPTRRTKRKLRRRGRAHLKIDVTFTPRGGVRKTAEVNLTLTQR